MAELSVFVDESGSADSRYYLLTLVFHNQEEPLDRQIELYHGALHEKGLPDVPFHASPLMNGHADYEGIPVEVRKRLFFTFFTMFRHFPVSYHTLAYHKRAYPGARLGVQMRRDIVNLVFDDLEHFQAFDAVKVYYDDGQKVVTNAVRDAAEYALSKEAVLYRKGDPRTHRLAQAADLICTVELAAIKYASGNETATDVKFFGSQASFRRNILKPVRRKRI